MPFWRVAERRHRSGIRTVAVLLAFKAACWVPIAVNFLVSEAMPAHSEPILLEFFWANREERRHKQYFCDQRQQNGQTR